VNPTTMIDPRYSDPKAVAVGWNDTRTLLESAELFWICTVRPDGRPHVTPLVAVWLDGAIHFHTGAKEQKLVNLHDNPHVVLVTGCNQWDRGVDVVVEGDAVKVTDPAMLERLVTAWGRKWDGRWDELASEVFSVVPTTVYSHAKGDPFGQTTHRF
jgi:nitroimidazol reductase NimA-like FMN-containing flavoprotein (pyridoxamine 5'-phosphate oxidase superfamily)